MPDYFFDSSALVKRYINENGSGRITALTHPSTMNTLHIARITIVEVVAAVARRRRGASIASPDATSLLADFDFDIDHQYRIIEITPTLLQEARILADTQALRGYDAVQLAAALTINAELIAVELQELIFVSSDNELNAAAQSKGLRVENPITQM